MVARAGEMDGPWLVLELDGGVWAASGMFFMLVNCTF